MFSSSVIASLAYLGFDLLFLIEFRGSTDRLGSSSSSSLDDHTHLFAKDVC